MNLGFWTTDKASSFLEGKKEVVGESLKQLTACSIEFKRSSTFFWCICRAVYPISHIKEGKKKKENTLWEWEGERHWKKNSGAGNHSFISRAWFVWHYYCCRRFGINGKGEALTSPSSTSRCQWSSNCKHHIMFLKDFLKEPRDKFIPPS